MTPADLTPAVFQAWTPGSRAFAQQYLPLLQRLPLAVCPSFLKQMSVLDTSFPAEIATLRSLCAGLSALRPEQLEAILLPLRQLRLSPDLPAMDWVNHPDPFLAALSAWLWSSGQIDAFRNASDALFACIPSPHDDASRLAIVVVGRGSTLPLRRPFSRLQQHGLLLTSLRRESAESDILALFRAHAHTATEQYANWYVDGGSPWPNGYNALPATVTLDYPALDPLRRRILLAMESAVNHGDAGAEQLRSKMARTTNVELNAAELTPDPVLQRFYTELFTLSSGPQIFSTSFVQWTGRELCRRARPRTLLLRYAPRQQNRTFNTLLEANAPATPDADGALRDAEMGAFYTWIEMNRITAAGRGTLLVWREDTATALVIGRSAPAGAASDTPMTLGDALQRFG